jgi:hypothetical protein
MKNGSLLWKYNNTYSGLETPYGNYPTDIAAIADGKIFAFNTEHSPNYPLYKGESIRVVDAFTGKDVWTMMGWAGTTGGSREPTSVVADGFLVYYNFYDNQIYSIGKGPSATTINAPNNGVSAGTNVLIQGTVTDQSPGGTAKGTPAISDKDMSDWMAYEYMQKPKPANATGVPVKLTAIDPNGNYQLIGTVNSDDTGNYAVMWKPPVPGMYKVTATFEGSNSYWPSSAQTYFGITPAISTSTAAASPVAPSATSSSPVQTPASTETIASPTPSSAVPPSNPPPTMTYIAVAAVTVIVAIIAAALVLRKRK